MATSNDAFLISEFAHQTYGRPRIAERVAATLGLIACGPLLIAAAVAVRAASGRSPFIALRRIGRNGEEFWMLKLRTMWCVNDKCGDGARIVEHIASTRVPENKKLRDERVTSDFAFLLRKFSIDELPQLLHVVTGRMAIVGPRPLTRRELDLYYGDDSAEVLKLLPGMTGLWQVLGRNSLTYRQRRRLDLLYVRRHSPALDWKILMRTPLSVLSGRNAI